MAAEWYYVANQQQVGPVELQALRDMLRAGSLSGNDMIFGPGLTEWTRVRQVPVMHADGGEVGAASPLGAVGAASATMLAYRGMETADAGLSSRAMQLLQQTKPWTRFIAVMMFIGAGFMILGGMAMAIGGAMMTRGSRGNQAMPAALGAVYLALGAIYLAPAIYLNRFASRIAGLMRSRRMTDLEEALSAQKSFWKFAGIMTILMICIYAVMIVLLVVRTARF